MNCINIELVLFASFAIILASANFTSWRMQKHALASAEKAPFWKLLLGDVFLGAEYLSNKGVKWRRASVSSFILLLAWIAVYIYLYDKSWVCPYGLRS